MTDNVEASETNLSIHIEANALGIFVVGIVVGLVLGWFLF